MKTKGVVSIFTELGFVGRSSENAYMAVLVLFKT